MMNDRILIVLIKIKNEKKARLSEIWWSISVSQAKSNNKYYMDELLLNFTPALPQT
jgi:hypothetical protein